MRAVLELLAKAALYALLAPLYVVCALGVLVGMLLGVLELRRVDAHHWGTYAEGRV